MYACPNESSVKVTCHGSDIHAIAWTAEPYIPNDDPIIYVSADTVSLLVFRRGFIANLTNLTSSGNVADLSSELTIDTSEVDNGTYIRCVTYIGAETSQKTTTFYQAGRILLVIRHWNNTLIFQTHLI